jgi:hypothetical protein
MVRYLKLALAAGIASLVVAQAFRIDRTNPPITQDIAAPPEVDEILRRACYDCHSNEVVWPWYSHVAPVSWLLARDVREGRAELNFSTWDAYDPAKKAKKLKESNEEAAEGEMPPWFYVAVHRHAALTAADVERLRTWVTEERAKLVR